MSPRIAKIMWLSMLSLLGVLSVRAFRPNTSQPALAQPSDRATFGRAANGGVPLGSGPVRIVVFSSFRCPWCKEQLLSLDSLFAADPGLGVVYRHLAPAADSVAASASAGASCHRDWSVFYGYSIRAFERLTSSFTVSESRQQPSSIAQHNECTTNGFDDLGQSSSIARELSVGVTPTLFFQCRRHDGYLSLESLRLLLELPCE